MLQGALLRAGLLGLTLQQPPLGQVHPEGSPACPGEAAARQPLRGWRDGGWYGRGSRGGLLKQAALCSCIQGSLLGPVGPPGSMLGGCGRYGSYCWGSWLS